MLVSTMTPHCLAAVDYLFISNESVLYFESQTSHESRAKNSLHLDNAADRTNTKTADGNHPLGLYTPDTFGRVGVLG